MLFALRRQWGAPDIDLHFLKHGPLTDTRFISLSASTLFVFGVATLTVLFIYSLQSIGPIELK